MKPTPRIFDRFLTFGCLTNNLPLPMLLGKQSSRLLCLKVWDDVAGADDIQGAGKASSQISIWTSALIISLAAFYINCGGEQVALIRIN
jgi:hypothetical protein